MILLYIVYWHIYYCVFFGYIFHPTEVLILMPFLYCPVNLYNMLWYLQIYKIKNIRNFCWIIFPVYLQNYSKISLNKLYSYFDWVYIKYILSLQEELIYNIHVFVQNHGMTSSMQVFKNLFLKVYIFSCR